MQVKKRKDYIDVFRAIGIVCMVMGHIYFGKHFDFYIHAFHMPIFFIVSGYFFKADEVFTVFLKKKFKTLIIPYLVFGLLNYVLYSIFNYFIVHKALSADPLKHLLFVNTNGLYAGAMWFLTSLFFAEIVLFLVLKLKSPYRQVAIVLIALFGNVAVRIMAFRLPYALDAAFTGVGLMYIGYLIKNCSYSECFKRLTDVKTKFFAAKLVLLVAISLVLIRCNSYINMRQGLYGIIPLFWLNVVIASYALVMFSKRIVIGMNEGLKSYITGIGRYSIIYLCLNQIVIKVISWLAGHFVHVSDTALLLLEKVLIFVPVMLILWICSYIIINTKLKAILGR